MVQDCGACTLNLDANGRPTPQQFNQYLPAFLNTYEPNGRCVIPGYTYPTDVIYVCVSVTPFFLSLNASFVLFFIFYFYFYFSLAIFISFFPPIIRCDVFYFLVSLFLLNLHF